MLRGEKILVTGPTSQVGLPIVRALARENRVTGLARFRRALDREKLEAAGARCVAADLAHDPLDHVPDDFDVVLNFAVVRSGDFAYDLAANAEGAGRLLARCRGARAFVHCSSAAVYAFAGNEPRAEDAPLGDHHGALMPTYSISKIAAETVVRFASRQWGVPATIARLSVPYGGEGGWPWYHLLMMKAGQPIVLHPERPNTYNPIHEDDYTAHVPRLVEVASVGGTTLNWGGSEAVDVEAWCRHLSEITGLEARFETRERSVPTLPLDLARMHDLLGRTRVPWRDGIRRMVETRSPESLR